VQLGGQRRAHGISGSILNWIGEWLKRRQQRVVLNGMSPGCTLQVELTVVLLIGYSNLQMILNWLAQFTVQRK